VQVVSQSVPETPRRDNLDTLRPIFSTLSFPCPFRFFFNSIMKNCTDFVPPVLGQGAQWLGMGQELFAHEVFRKSVADAIFYLMSLGCYWHLAGKSPRIDTQISCMLIWVSVGAFTGELERENKMDEPGFAQPLCTILQVALVDLLESVNVRPAVVIGHSSGEIAAA
jgi:acyl transferase domain-containing protein